MSDRSTNAESAVSRTALPRTSQSSNAPNVTVCIGNELPAAGIIAHAQLISKPLGGSVVLIQVIEPPMDSKTPHDPVDWELRKREAKTGLMELAGNVTAGSDEVLTTLLEGPMIEEVCNFVLQRPQDITTVLRKSVDGIWDTGDPARRIMEADIGSVFMIPMELESDEPEKYRRIIVPLDGSCRAETAIPKAVRLAKAHDAELMLCHVTPAPGVNRIGPTDEKTIALQKQITRDNRHSAQEYLSRLEARLSDCGVQVSSRVSGNGDVRRSLLQLVDNEGADLIVLTSHGQSNHPDVPAGDIANFVIARSPVPVLMVRQPNRSSRDHVYSNVKSKGVRLASATMQ